MPASGPGPASFYLGWEASLVNLSQILGFLDAPLHPSMTFLSVGKFFLGTSLLLPVPHWRDTLMATETQALSTPGEAEEGRVGHPIHRFQSGLGGGPCSHTCLALSPFPGDAGCGWERGRVSPLLLSQQATRTHWCTCPLMSPPVLSCFCFFSASESPWEQSSDWNKGDLRMEIWPSPSGSPSPWGPSTCSGLGGGDRGICDPEGVKGWLHLSRRGTVSWEGGLEKGTASRQAWSGKASWRKRYLN